MFSKLISKMALNPSAVDQLAFYGRRLKKEESIRRMGLCFVILSMFVQIFAAMFPAERSLAASNNDVIRGGVSSLSQLKESYSKQADVRELYKRFGLTSDDMTASRAQNTTFKFQDQGSKGTRTVGRVNFASTKDHNLGSYAGSTFYSRSASEWQGSAPAYYFGKHKGTDNNFYYVWVLKDCGNIAYRLAESTTTPKPDPKPDPKPTPTPKPTPAPKPTPVVKPEVACSRLTADKTLGKKSVVVRFTGAYSANQDNLVNGYTFDFGDGEKVKHDGAVIDHTYTNDSLKKKTYSVTLTINSTLGDKKSSACRTTITLLPEVCEINPALKPDDAKCGVCEYNPNYNPTDPRCKPAPVCENNPALKPDDPKCKCLDKPELPADDPNCLTPSRLKKVKNITQNLSPEKTLTSQARAGDVMEYTLITTNTNVVSRSGYIVDDYIGDILDYAELDVAFLKKQGGTYLADSKTVVWENQTIPARGDIERSFRVIMKNPLPATNTPNATATDYDCKLQNSYGNETIVMVECPILKQVETLPNTGPGTTIGIAFTITVISSYFFARSRLLAKEVNLVKKTYQHAGF